MPEGSPISKSQVKQLEAFLKPFGNKVPQEINGMLHSLSKAKRYFVIPIEVDGEPVIVSGMVLSEKIPVRAVYDPIDFLYVIKVAKKLEMYLQQQAQEEKEKEENGEGSGVEGGNTEGGNDEESGDGEG